MVISSRPDRGHARGGGERGAQLSPGPLVWLAQVIREAGQEPGYELLSLETKAMKELDTDG